MSDADGGAASSYESPVAAPRNLSWSADGGGVLFDGGDEGRPARLDVAGAVTTVIGGDDAYGAAFAAFSPISEQDVTYVVRACCRRGSGDGSFETLELGVITGGSFARMKGLDDFGLDPNSRMISLASAGGLDYEVDDGWRRYDDRSWFVSDGVTLLLVDDNGEADRVPVENAGGVAANPAFTE